MPSVLAFLNGQVYVGAGAKDLRARIGDLKLEQNRDIFWDCKNDIGVRKTYHKAPIGYRSAKEIGGHLLQFLIDSASGDDTYESRRDGGNSTGLVSGCSAAGHVDAARLAGIELTAGALLDEPVAAFIDYVFSHGTETFAGISGPRSLAVFDFGGGTCDVAVFELRPPKLGAPVGVGVAPLSVSRYHRLGGGEIDRKIVAEVLIPQPRRAERPATPRLGLSRQIRLRDSGTARVCGIAEDRTMPGDRPPQEVRPLR